MKKVMILGAGRGQVDLINATIKYGYEPIVASVKGNYPGLNMGVKTVDVDISDKEAVLECAKSENIDAIVTACMDLGVPALGYVCDNMNLPGLSAKAAEICENKYLMKQAFAENGVATAKHLKVASEVELMEKVKNLQYPLIIKAVDLQGSRGINIVREKENLISAYNATMSETRESFCIVEEFIEGYEFGAEAFVADGEILFVLPCGEETYLADTNIPVGHYTPLEMNQEMQDMVFKEVEKAILATGLNNCAIDVDLIVKENKVYVIELTGRIGANCLTQLTSIYYGIDIYRMILDVALGINPKTYYEETKKNPTACYARMLFMEKSGVLKNIINNNSNNEYIEEITFFVKPGDTIRKFNNSKDCIAQIVVKADSVEQGKKYIEEVEKNILLELE